MAELFSLIPESASCKTDRVEANRTLFRSTLPASFHGDTFVTIRSHQSNQQDTKAQRTDAFPRAVRGNAYSSCLGVFVFLGVLVFNLSDRVRRPENRGTKKATEADPFGEFTSILKEYIF
ncbi:MAG: hypothetical protein WA740_16275 [Candidatus Binataceae bacterium]